MTQDTGPAQPNERRVKSRCMICGFEGDVIERTIGAGLRITICDRCSFAGEQALALVHTARPFVPATQKFLGGLLNAVLPRR